MQAALEGNRDRVHHAALLDRHASSVLSMDEIRGMVDELIEAHGDAMRKVFGSREPERLPQGQRRALGTIHCFRVADSALE